MNIPKRFAFPKILKIVIALFTMILFAFWIWRQFSSPEIISEKSQRSQPIADHIASLPHKGGPPGYVGSSSCVDCHKKQYATWHRSYHRTMTQAASPISVKADFDDVVLEARGERFHLTREGDAFWISISDPSEKSEALRLQLAMITGSHHMQVFWLPGVLGNMQLGFPFTWLIEDSRWVPRHDTFIRDPDIEPGVEVWNQVCIRCHTTGGIPKPNAQKRIFETEVVELGISCEACHGPAQKHIAFQKSRQNFLNDSENENDSENFENVENENFENANHENHENRDPIVQPENLSAERSSQICGNCHSMKWFDKNEKWQAKGFRFRPGEDLNETTPVIRASKLAEQPWLHSVISKHPDLLKSFFWSDGMIRVSGREYNGLLESACHTRGELSCISCHSMHSSEPKDQLAHNRKGNQACTQCHEIDDSHSHHKADSSGSLCYNCHMPHTSYGILKAIRSHQIDSPSIRVEKETGRPNACNLCHANQTLAWSAAHLNRWFGQEIPSLSKADRDIPAMARHLLEGDAGARALAAWTLGWRDSIAASGEDWQAGILARALNDRYSAVRYIAGKSIQKMPGFADFEYDFVADLSARKNAVKQALEKWILTKPVAKNPQIRFFDSSGLPKEAIVLELLKNQDQTPIRLRE